MKSLVLTALVALGVALPSLASAMQHQSVHSEKAKKIFMQLAEESRGDGS